jgi:hypothetical protein
MMTTRLSVLFLLGLVLSSGQSMPGPGIPFPRRSSKNKKPDLADLDTLKGVLRKMTDTEMTVEADDKRIMTITRNATTKFLEREEPTKPDLIEPGDRVMVDASQDDHGRYTAVEVRVTKRGTPEDRARARVPVPSADDSQPAPESAKDSAKDSSKDKPKTEVASAPPQPVERPATEMAPPKPRDNPDDDRPKLARGKAAPRKSSDDDETTAKDDLKDDGKPIAPRKADDIASQRAAELERLRRADDPPSADRESRDEFIEKARDTAANFVETLPNYSVKQFTTRFQSDNPRVNWQPIDNVSTDVVYENGKENYKNIQVNGKAPKGKLEDSGTWSTGEFGTVLLDIFSPASAADFRPAGTSTIVNRTAKIYKFVVEQPTSHWRISTEGQSYFASYKGTMWIDKETFRVLRIEMQTRNMPKAFPLDMVESAVDYDFIRLGGVKSYLLPVHAENLACVRGTSTCSKNIIDFRNYRKFGAESTIIFK